MDIVLRGALVADGTGDAITRHDVGITGTKIASVAEAGSLAGRRNIDADGLVLAPGFIDMHSHSDLQLLANPDHPAKITQGVTTEVLGQDGLSYAPVDDVVLEALRQQLAGWNDDPPGFDWNWRSVGEYLDRLDRGIAVNAAYLVPQGTVRMLAVGWDDRPATDAELDRMKATGRDRPGAKARWGCRPVSPTRRGCTRRPMSWSSCAGWSANWAGSTARTTAATARARWRRSPR